MGGGGRNGCLLDAAVVESTCGAVEGYSISGVALAVRVEEIGCVDLAVEAECSGGGLVQDVSDILGGSKVLDDVV